MVHSLLLPWPEGEYLGSAWIEALRHCAGGWALQNGCVLEDASGLDLVALRARLDSDLPAFLLGIESAALVGRVLNRELRRGQCVELPVPTVASSRLGGGAASRLALVDSWQLRGLSPLTDLYFGESFATMEEPMMVHLRREVWP